MKHPGKTHMMKKKTQHEIESISVFSALSRQCFYPISEYYNGTYVSMTNRGNNNPYTLSIENCIPLLTTITNAYNEVEKLTADIPLLCTRLRVCQQCGFALSSENKI